MRFIPVPVSPAHRWIAFNSVGAIGFAVQMGVLFLPASIAGWHYLPATEPVATRGEGASY